MLCENRGDTLVAWRPWCLPAHSREFVGLAHAADVDEQVWFGERFLEGLAPLLHYLRHLGQPFVAARELDWLPAAITVPHQPTALALRSDRRM